METFWVVHLTAELDEKGKIEWQSYFFAVSIDLD